MELVEKDLEDMIYDACKTKEGLDFLQERGLMITGKAYRQVNLGSYGIADLITVTYEGRGWEPIDIFSNDYIMTRHFTIDIYELKRDKIGIDALLQVCRYCTGFKKLILPKFNTKRNEFNIRIHLIGSSIDLDSDFVFLLDHITRISLYTYQFRYDGLHFEESPTSGWTKSNSGNPQELTVTRHFLRELVGHLPERIRNTVEEIKEEQQPRIDSDPSIDESYKSFNEFRDNSVSES
ncbi:hypothetical protein [Spirosoma aerolatum]|uniref:hypothetical protein n=1 Tax=Spirosoma aerolatum TaxID=1211326 RepID=UPI0012D34DC6|nr:hypothetical protein [Spirosoma aerolatum]